MSPIKCGNPNEALLRRLVRGIAFLLLCHLLMFSNEIRQLCEGSSLDATEIRWQELPKLRPRRLVGQLLWLADIGVFSGQFMFTVCFHPGKAYVRGSNSDALLGQDPIVHSFELGERQEGIANLSVLVCVLWDSPCFEMLWQLVQVIVLYSNKVQDSNESVFDDCSTSSGIDAGANKCVAKCGCVAGIVRLFD